MSEDQKKSPLCFISAGEVSGDLIGADLMNRLRAVHPDIRFYGIGGESMQKAGMDQIVDQKQLRFMGFFDVLANLFKIKKILSYTISEIEKRSADFVILIDYPGFHFKLAGELKKRGFKVFQYICPKVWAWASWRVKKLEKNFDAVFGVFPFEIDYFKPTQVKYYYVGSFHKERIDTFVSSTTPLELPGSRLYKIACFPGSRRTEFKENFYTIWQVMDKLQEKLDTAYYIPVASGFSTEDLLAHLPKNIRSGIELESCGESSLFSKVKGKDIYFIYEHSLDVLRSSWAALIVEGTSTLESALLRIPFTAIYNPGLLLTVMGKLLLKIPYVSLDNIVAGKLVTSEFIKDYSVDDVVKQMLRLCLDTAYRAQLDSEFVRIHSLLESGRVDIVETIDSLTSSK